jgi:hypothetical protein
MPAHQKPDFMSCLATIQDLSIQQRAESGCFNNPSEGMLSYNGCTLMCGPGIQLWEWKDTFNRISLLVLPTLFLLAHLAFPPLGWKNYVVVIVHAVGNPVGSLRSLLARLEKHRALRRAAMEMFPREPLISGALATISAAYEELGWHDVSQSFTARKLDTREILIIIRASHALSSIRQASIFSAIVPIVTLVGTLATAIIRTIQQISENNTRVYIDTTHTIAVVCLLFFSIPQVWFSARLGTFTSDSDAFYIIKTMNTHLEETSRPLFPPLKQLANSSLPPGTGPSKLPLWLRSQLPRRIKRWLSDHHVNHHKLSQYFNTCPLLPASDPETRTRHQTWHKKSSYLFINSSWRPCTHSTPLLYTSILYHLLGACLPAIFLSATNHTDKRLIAIGCRSGTWIIITGLWILSLCADRVFVYFCSQQEDPVSKIKALWRRTVVKDAIAMFVVISLVFVVEIGTYNSCWCRASFSHPAVVEIMPYSAAQWALARGLWVGLPSAGLFFNLLLILWFEVGWGRRRGGSPLNKGGDEKKLELKALKRLEKEYKTKEGEEKLRGLSVSTTLVFSEED